MDPPSMYSTRNMDVPYGSKLKRESSYEDKPNILPGGDRQAAVNLNDWYQRYQRPAAVSKISAPTESTPINISTKASVLRHNGLTRLYQNSQDNPFNADTNTVSTNAMSPATSNQTRKSSH